MQREILIDEHGRLESPVTEISPPPSKNKSKTLTDSIFLKPQLNLILSLAI